MPDIKKPSPSVASELFKVTWPFAAGFLAIMTAGIISSELIMAIRAYGYGENVWLKSQKTAVFQLLRYAGR
jgi:hypothetical protein